MSLFNDIPCHVCVFCDCIPPAYNTTQIQTLPANTAFHPVGRRSIETHNMDIFLQDFVLAARKTQLVI